MTDRYRAVLMWPLWRTFVSEGAMPTSMTDYEDISAVARARDQLGVHLVAAQRPLLGGTPVASEEHVPGDQPLQPDDLRRIEEPHLVEARAPPPTPHLRREGSCLPRPRAALRPGRRSRRVRPTGWCRTHPHWFAGCRGLPSFATAAELTQSATPRQLPGPGARRRVGLLRDPRRPRDQAEDLANRLGPQPQMPLGVPLAIPHRTRTNPARRDWTNRVHDGSRGCRPGREGSVMLRRLAAG